MKICLDAGHGGRDPGAVGPTGLEEADVALQIVRVLKKMLIEKGHETVVLTRSADKEVHLATRSAIANAARADLFISVHLNAGTPSAHGVEVYHHTNSSQASKNLAALVYKELDNLPLDHWDLEGRGVKSANFAVLRETNMPAILVEVAFISNPTEEALSKKQAFVEKVAGAIYRGVQAVSPRSVPAKSAGGG